MIKIPYYRPLDITLKTPKLDGILSNGKYVETLEKAIKEMYDVDYVIACSSASIGLLISLQVLKKLRNINSIITPAFGWFSSKWAIKTLNIAHIWEDIDISTWLLTKNYSTRSAYLPIHTFGNIHTNLSKNMYTIYDGAHALGSIITKFGMATVISLAPTKIVTSCEGGLILTNYDDMATEIKKLRDKVSRMSELNAIWGLETLSKINETISWNHEVYHYYKKHLPGTFQEIPFSSNYSTIGFLTALRIPPEIEYKQYYEPLYRGLENTEDVYKRMVCLPSWFGVDYKYIVDKILWYNLL